MPVVDVRFINNSNTAAALSGCMAASCCHSNSEIRSTAGWPPPGLQRLYLLHLEARRAVRQEKSSK